MLEKIRKLVGAVFWKIALVLTSQPEKSKPEWVQVKAGPIQDAYLYVDLRDGSSREMVEGTYDSFIFEALHSTQVLERDFVAWDIGAHIGYHSLVFASLTNLSGRVYAFEPNPYNADRFNEHMERNPGLADKITLYPYAVSDIDGKQSFRFSPQYHLSTIGYLGTEDTIPSERISRATYHKLETTMVEVKSIDSLIHEGMEPPDLIKIDVEGAEVQVLQGASETLASNRPVLILEIHNISNMFHIQAMLLEIGYKTKFLDDPKHPSSSRGFLLAI